MGSRQGTRRVQLRFHDLRHSAISRLLDAGVDHAIVSELAGWSTSTAIRMLKVYGHVGLDTRRAAIAQRERFMQEQALQESPQKSPQTQTQGSATIQ